MNTDQILFERFLKKLELPDVSLMLRVASMLSSDDPYDERWTLDWFGSASSRNQPKQS
ncbi:MAG: hypothetical protein AAF542_05965 [Pseudomonadota bacterium]